MKKLTIGRTVHFVLHEGPNKGAIRPAVIVNNWGSDDPDQAVQLQVFTDSSNDDLPPVLWVTSAHQSLGKEERTFHFPELIVRD
jgi:hypothetical protein